MLEPEKLLTFQYSKFHSLMMKVKLGTAYKIHQQKSKLSKNSSTRYISENRIYISTTVVKVMKVELDKIKDEGYIIYFLNH